MNNEEKRKKKQFKRRKKTLEKGKRTQRTLKYSHGVNVENKPMKIIC